MCMLSRNGGDACCDDSGESASQEEGEIAACNYHAGMTPKQRIQVQNQWRSGVLQVVVATIAFGMGERFAGIKVVSTSWVCLSGSRSEIY